MAFGDVQEAVVDQTLVFDPAAVWPDPQACPDWSAPMGDRALASRGDAEDRLLMLHRTLGRGRPTRPPSPEEAEQLRSEHFREITPDTGPWSLSLGLRGITWRDHVKESAARQMVEALHLRGYLRKLEDAETRRVETRVAEQVLRHQDTVDGYADACRALAAQADPLRDAAARHEQREADERAYFQLRELRQQRLALAGEAGRSAAILQVALPDVPPFD